MVPRHVLQTFGLSGEPQRLYGGSVATYRIANAVLKRIHKTSFENQNSLELAPWLAEQLHIISEDGFRISRPIPAQDGRWVLDDGWMAWAFVEGEPVAVDHLPAAIESVRKLHEALRHVPMHPLLEQNETAWGFAQRYCFAGRPSHVHPVLEALVDELYEHWTQIPPLPSQLIHGDLCPGNVLVSSPRPTGFIDFTPFWAPVDFALAMFANWVGPRQGDASVLRYFEDMACFDQLLIRAAIRMLLVVSHSAGVEGWEQSPEKRAAEMVLDYVS
jgi:Ser/Thr protein kinase RdoA (MazF antagonist)